MNVLESLKLDGKLALVTGGSRGLGRQMAEALGQAGARLILTSRHMEELVITQQEFKVNGIETHIFEQDMSQFEQLPTFVQKVLDDIDGIDILVNNAGTSWGAPSTEIPMEAWQKVMDVNLNGLFLLTREVVKQSMLKNGKGKIINTASISGLSGRMGGIPISGYSVSKAAVIHLTKVLADEWGKKNINVNAICPGFFHTKMSSGIPEEFLKGLAEHTPLGRLGEKHDLQGLVVFLASSASDYITGQAIALDGGYSL